jgi:DNA mismatch endonuclease (patch repair protein)
VSPNVKLSTSKERSEIMRKIKGRDTKPEIILRKSLWARGYRYRISPKDMPGKPDIVFRKNKLVIFVDGEFWHGYDWDNKKRRIKNNREYWLPKIEKNMARDSNNNSYYKYNGWRVLRFWQNDIMKNLTNCIDQIEKVIKKSNYVK